MALARQMTRAGTKRLCCRSRSKQIKAAHETESVLSVCACSYTPWLLPPLGPSAPKSKRVPRETFERVAFLLLHQCMWRRWRRLGLSLRTVTERRRAAPAFFFLLQKRVHLVFFQLFGACLARPAGQVPPLSAAAAGLPVPGCAAASAQTRISYLSAVAPVTFSSCGGEIA